MTSNLAEDLSSPLSWFRYNHVAANTGQFQVMSLGMKEQPKLILEVDDEIIALGNKVELLGVIIDSQLKLQEHIKALCPKANRKESAFSRMASFLNHKKGKILANTFIMPDFNYCTLIWMYHGKT